jgi:hypothetical protein
MRENMDRLNKAARTAATLVAVAALAGCEAIALTSLGVGGSTAVNHTLSGMTYRTFTAPLPRVKSASLSALNRMGIRVASSAKNEGNEVLKANAKDREIEIVLEPVSANTTRMKVVAKNGALFYDSATATEIILQTERILGNA